jgi:hypothetical protein
VAETILTVPIVYFKCQINHFSTFQKNNFSHASGLPIRGITPLLCLQGQSLKMCGAITAILYYKLNKLGKWLIMPCSFCRQTKYIFYLIKFHSDLWMVMQLLKKLLRCKQNKPGRHFVLVLRVVQRSIALAKNITWTINQIVQKPLFASHVRIY